MRASARHVIIPPHPPHPPRAWIQVMCSSSMCASARYVIIPPPHPPHPPRAWVQVILMRPSDPNFWSQVTAKCGHKWPRALWRFCWPCQRMWRFVVASDRILWSQVTAMPLRGPIDRAALPHQQPMDLIIDSCKGARWFLKGGPILPSLRFFWGGHPLEGAFCMSIYVNVSFSVVKVDTWKCSDSGHLDSERERERYV